MLDTKSTFDDLVATHAGDPEQAERILANRFYRNISGALSGTQEYMAMEKLYELHDEHRLRPRRRRHAADPQRPRLPRRAPAADPVPRPPPLPDADGARPAGIVKAVNVAAQAFLRTVSKVVGGEVDRRRHRLLPGLRRHGGGLQRPGRRACSSCCRDRRRPRSCWWRRPARDTVEEATFFAAEAGRGRHPVRALIVNRMHPRFGDGLAEADARAGRARSPAPTSAASTPTWPTSACVAAREEEHLAGLAERVAPAPVVRVPFLPHRRARPRRPRRGRPRTCSADALAGVAGLGAGDVRRVGLGERAGGGVDGLGDRRRCGRSRWCAAGG